MGYGDTLFFNQPGQGHKGASASDRAAMAAPAPATPAFTPAPAAAMPVVDNSAQDAYWNDKNAREAAAAQAAADAAAAERKRNIANVQGFFNQYGMNALWGGAFNLLTQGYTDPTQIALMLSNDAQYQQAYYNRFPAVKEIRAINGQRAAMGLPPRAEPSPAAYVELEAGYRKAVAGLPGTWGTTTDISEWIIKEVSPTEVAERVTTATNYIYYDANSFVKDELRGIYGLTDQEMVAYVLDPDRAQEEIEQQYSKRMAQATVGGAADSLGVSLADAQRNEIAGSDLYGKSFGNAASGFKAIAEIDDAYERLGKLSNVKTNTGELVSDQFGISGAADAAGKKKKLASQERARFGGQSAVSRTSLAQKRAR